MSFDDFSIRMKKYEKCNSTKLTPRCPVIIRLDGKAFHTFTRTLKDKTKLDPFNEDLKDAFVHASIETVKAMDGVKAVYTQSDEVSILLTDDANDHTLGWFDFKVQKMVSVSASLFTYHFNNYFKHPNNIPALFDARVFSLPNYTEVDNYFIWRQQDATRNSQQMIGHHHFSPKKLHKKSCNQIQEMLYSEKDINWNNLDEWKRRGTLIVKTTKKYDTSYIDKKGNTVNVIGAKKKLWTVVDCPIFTQTKLMEVVNNKESYIEDEYTKKIIENRKEDFFGSNEFLQCLVQMRLCVMGDDTDIPYTEGQKRTHGAVIRHFETFETELGSHVYYCDYEGIRFYVSVGQGSSIWSQPLSDIQGYV